MSFVHPASETAIAEAAGRLRAHEPVAFPTETVYGLGAGTRDRLGLDRIYAIKGRPRNNPLIAHVSGAAMARGLVAEWPADAEALVERFWPGPLALILPRAADVPDEATAGLDTIAVRAPKHEVARALIEAYGAAISAPSANRSGHVSPTTAQHVADDLDGVFVLDGGPCAGGIESTVLRLGGDAPQVLRRGHVTAAQIEDVLGVGVEVLDLDAQDASPGTAARHYAPDVPVELVEGDALVRRLDMAEAPVAVLTFDASAVDVPHVALEMPRDAAAYAAQLYDALRRAERSARYVIVEHPPSDDAWVAVRDRLNRAVSA